MYVSNFHLQLETRTSYSRKIHVGNHSHDAGNLIGSGDASNLALRADRPRELVFLGLEDGGLMQADCGGVNAHVGKDNVGVPQPRGELQV